MKRLAKKYPSLKTDFSAVGKNCFKIRFAVTSKGKGKSDGARIITNVVISEKIVYLLSIYDKSEKGNLSDTELKELLKYVPD